MRKLLLLTIGLLYTSCGPMTDIVTGETRVTTQVATVRQCFDPYLARWVLCDGFGRPYYNYGYYGQGIFGPRVIIYSGNTRSGGNASSGSQGGSTSNGTSNGGGGRSSGGSNQNNRTQAQWKTTIQSDLWLLP